MKETVGGNMKQIVLLRHGESAWNKENRFTGWTDMPHPLQHAARPDKVCGADLR
ncbi:MAG TPA: hypothetical protein DDZ40_12190 [Deltaproteobacteria bacterium]|nr:hypothetical protein [Deltaproteobacteria bacterium]